MFLAGQRGRLPAALGLAALLAAPSGAAADELEFRPLRDGVITGSAGLFWLANELFMHRIAPASCRWCDRTGEVDTLNGFDRAFRDGLVWRDTDRAAGISDAAAYVVAPLSALGLTALVARADGALDNYLTDAGLILEATFLAASLNQVVKVATARERPFVHELPAEDRPLTDRPEENNLSFYSGHTSLAFSLAVSSGTVASLRGYRHAWVVWAAGTVTASATGYLRIAASKHYATDVLTAAALSSLIGFGVPWWSGRRRAPDDGAVRATLSPAGLGLAGRF